MITNQIVEYPNNLWKIAEHISKARTLLSEDVYAEGTDKFRGLQEKEISINGVIGELIVQWYCKEKHPYKKIKFASLVDLDPQPEPDMIFDDGVTIDIKTIPINIPFFPFSYISKLNCIWVMVLGKFYCSGFYFR